MTFSRNLAGTAVAIMLIWLAFATLAPIAIGMRPVAQPKHNCPKPVNAHGVGSDLKTYRRSVDRCKDL